MRILLCGANGFVGRHLEAALSAAGHDVLRGVRRAVGASDVAMDYRCDVNAKDWLPRLANVDVVINAVGILSEGAGARFDSVHKDAPCALFNACIVAGVRRVIQISALGGLDEPLTPYMRSKREADACLMRSGLDWTILRPSLLVGADGASSRLFRTLASLPVIGLPGQGEQRLQPLHVDDLCAVVVKLTEYDDRVGQVLDLAGPQVLSYRQMLKTYRQAMDLSTPLFLPLPMPVMRLSAKLAAALPQKVFTTDTLRMLEEGNTADAAILRESLGRAPREPGQWFAGIAPVTLRAEALSTWILPLLRLSIALVWIVTGLLSLGWYPVQDSLSLLAQLGLRGEAALFTLYGAALLDLLLGVATLVMPTAVLWRAQLGLVLLYTFIISVWLPGYWLHPFGPVLKNIPLIAVLMTLNAAESK
jgi:uncharacterized protein YbjT (DUF2867 family)